MHPPDLVMSSQRLLVGSYQFIAVKYPPNLFSVYSIEGVLTMADQVDSRPDLETGETTRLVFTQEADAVPVMSLRLLKNAQPEVELLRANLRDIFTIRFNKFDLDKKRMTGEFVEYKSSRLSASSVIQQVGEEVHLTYSATAPQFDSIQVTIFVSPAADARNAGWVNLNLHHTFPSEIKSGVDNGFAWEEQLTYPVFRLNPAQVPNHRSIAGPLKFAALYKQIPGVRERVEGMAVHIGDQTGQHTEISFHEPSPDAPALRLSFKLINSMHLKDGVYVRPDDYTLALGDAFGYGGNGMLYRLRAFRLEGVCDGAPVDWYDVAHIYRRWLDSRQPSFYKKYKPRTQPAPVDTLSPHTIISNYGFNGQVDPSVRDGRFLDLPKWLELHPVKDTKPDMVDNKNESFLRLLSRTRSAFRTWSDWEDLGQPHSTISVAASPAVASWAANRLDCFVRGSDGQMWHKWWDGSAWNGWEPLGGALVHAPAAVSRGPNRIDCFVHGTDGQMWHKWFDGARWKGWEPRGGELASSPAVASWGPNRLDCFMRDTDGALHTQWWDGSRWNGWARVQGEALADSAPGAVSWGPNRIDCFVRGKDGALYHKWFDGRTWNTGWEHLGAPSGTIRLASAPAVSSLGPNHLEIFVRGTDNALWQKVWDGAWRGWERLGGTFGDNPAAVSWGPNRIDCFVRGTGNTMLHKWSAVDTPLEAQLWGFEMGGYYQFFGGFPPATEAISGNKSKFKLAMDELTANGIIPIVTTDPLLPITDHMRYAGHVILDANRRWQEAIPHPFPQKLIEETCADTNVKIDGKLFERVFFVLPRAEVEQPQRICADAVRLQKSLKVAADGTTISGPAPAIGTGMFRANICQLCPTKDLSNTYIQSWLVGGLLSRGVRLIEFMKHNPRGATYCYDKTHQHIIPKPVPPPGGPEPLYNNAIGAGHWYVMRIQAIFKQLYDEGLKANAAFALSHEFTPTEHLVPYIDDYYDAGQSPNSSGQGGDPLFHFVYSRLVKSKMHVFRDPEIHAGYKEARKSLHRATPTYMLDPARDIDDRPLTLFEIGLLPTEPPDIRDNAYRHREQTFTTWRSECRKYFDDNFKIREYGLAPRGYPIESRQALPNFDPSNPTADTTPPSYTYIRCVQDVFNLRAAIFEVAARAVFGERVIVPSTMMEEPYDYNEEALAMSARAFQLHRHFLKFFKDGFMLGETAIRRTVYLPEKPATTFDGHRLLWAWGSAFRTPRPFDDVHPLVTKIERDNAQLGKARFPIVDFISRPVDRVSLKRNPQDPDPFFRNEIVIYRQVPHMVWQYGAGDAREILYAFANGGNTDLRVEFLYGRGFEGTSPSTSWKKTTTIFTGSEINRASETVPLLGTTEMRLTIPARSFAAISIKR